MELSRQTNRSSFSLFSERLMCPGTYVFEATTLSFSQKGGGVAQEVREVGVRHPGRNFFGDRTILFILCRNI